MRSPTAPLALLVFALCLLLLAVGPRGAAAQTQSREQRRCIVATQKVLTSIANARMLGLVRCTKRAAKGASPADCSVAEMRMVERVRVRTAIAAERRCLVEPEFGATHHPTATKAGLHAANFLFEDVFGPDLNSTLVEASEDKQTAKCQQRVAKRLAKCQRARLAEFARCARAGLLSGEINSAEAMAACVEIDPRGKIARACSGFRECLPEALPGCDLSAEGSSLDACVARASECRACLAVNAAGALGGICEACTPEP